MLNAVQLAPPEATLTVSPAESMEIGRIAEQLQAVSDEVDDDAWVAAARASWQSLPGTFRQRIREFRRDSGPGGVLVVRGLPVDESGCRPPRRSPGPCSGPPPGRPHC